MAHLFKKSSFFYGLFVFVLIVPLSISALELHQAIDCDDDKKATLDTFDVYQKMPQAAHRHIIDIENLHLYKILTGIKAVLLAQGIEYAQQEQFSAAQEIVSTELFSVNQAINLLKHIVQKINAGALAGSLEIEYKIVKTYNSLEDKEISPQVLRDFVAALEVFDRDIARIYSRKKYFLNKDSITLIGNVRKLNLLLKQSIIKEDLFDFTAMQLATDIFFHRPWEFACKHKMVTGGIVLAAIGLVVAWYGYPRYVSYKLANQNPNYNCHQLHAFSQSQGSLDCGFFATAHTLLMMSEPGNVANVEQLQERLNTISSLNPILENLRQVVPAADRQGWIHGDAIAGFLHPDILNRFARDFAAVGVSAQNINFDDIHFVEIGGRVNRRVALALRHPNEALAQPVGFLGQPDVQVARAWFARSVNRFRNLNRPQGFIISLGNHWIAMRLQRDAQGVIQPILADSVWLANRTNNQIVNHIVQLYNTLPDDALPVESDYGNLNIAPSLDDMENVLNLPQYQGGENARYQAVFNHFSRALQSLGAAENRQQELVFYRDRMNNLFLQMRNDAQAFGIQQLVSDVVPHVVDLNNVQTLDQCVFAVLGHQIA